MSFKSYITPRNAFLLSCMMLATGLGCSNILMSWGEIGLVIAFLWEGKYATKWKSFRNNKRLLALSALYFIFLAGLIYTSNFHYALHDLKIKLPILLTPFFMHAFFPLTKKEIRIIFHFLYLGAIITMIAGALMYFDIIQLKMIDMRSYSPFIAHLRVGTLLVFLIFISIYIYKNKEYRITPAIVYLIFPLFAFVYLLLIQSLTGFAAFIGTLAILCLQGILKKETRIISTVSIVLFILISFFMYRLFYTEYQRVHEIEKVNFSELPKSTIRGNLYKQDTLNKETINGHYIYINVCPWELQQTWDKRSQMEYFGVTKKGWPLSHTLIRYLASKGLKKNAESVNSLTDKEVRAIENGIDNYLNVNVLDIRYRINQLCVELDKYEKTGDPNYMSFSTRLETWKVARYTISKSPVIGFGTGDVRDQMKISYQETNSKLIPQFWLNPHQQYFTVAIATGIIGLILFIGFTFFPVISFRKLHPLFLACLCILGIAMLDEDILETQAGTTQFIFMYVFTYILHKQQKQMKNEISA